MGHMLNRLHCVLDEAAPILAGDAAIACECRLQGCGVVVARGGCLLVCRKLASSLELFWIAGGRCLTLWDSSSGEGVFTYPVDSRIRVCRSSCLLVIPVILALLVDHIFSFRLPEQPVKNFALTVQVSPFLGGLVTRPSGAPVSHALAYQDFPDDALAALSFIRHARQLWTILIKVHVYVVNNESRVYGPECGLSSGPALRAFGSRGLGVSTFSWGRVTDTRERRSRYLSFYDPKVEGG
ncbi:hypothetical protein CRG98_018977 [Punica granatum]|uniref:Uncharacterized protein n=1 Tax=Punica granatum TaxID=22663 RepID=A0A2I0JWD6_PUNGR|nr:hypothetical protein CRG98_018977 [Punica granatum]